MNSDCGWYCSALQQIISHPVVGRYISRRWGFISVLANKRNLVYDCCEIFPCRFSAFSVCSDDCGRPRRKLITNYQLLASKEVTYCQSRHSQLYLAAFLSCAFLNERFKWFKLFQQWTNGQRWSRCETAFVFLQHVKSMHATLFIDHKVPDPKLSLPFELCFYAAIGKMLATQSHDSKLPWLIPFSFQYRKFAWKVAWLAWCLAFQLLSCTFLLADFRNWNICYISDILKNLLLLYILKGRGSNPVSG